MFPMLKRFTALLNKRSAAAARSQRSRWARPGLETLEDRVVPAVSPNGWHTAVVAQAGQYYGVYDTSLGPTDLAFHPIGPVLQEYSSLPTTNVNSPPQFNSTSTVLSFVMQTDVNSSQEFDVPLTNPTSISLAESVASSTYGQPVTYTATVISLPGTPAPATGLVEFDVDGTSAGLASVLPSHTATIALKSDGGTHDVTAKYLAANGYYNSVDSVPVVQTVGPAATGITLTQSAILSTYGQPMSFSAAVSSATSGLGMSGGSVSFYDGSSPLGTVNLDVTGHAVLAVASLPAGTHSVTAQYNGSANFAVSPLSNAAGETVARAQTTLALGASPTSVVYGTAVSFTAGLKVSAPGAGTPGGLVSFYDGSSPLGTANLSAGKAVLPVAALPAGSHIITATYAGDANFAGSQSATPVTETVSLNLGTPTLPAETAGQDYGTALGATGGSGHYSYALANGSTLPVGLSLSGAGLVSGIATRTGTFSFTVAAADTAWAGVGGSLKFTLTVNAAAPAVLTITAPTTVTAGTAFQVALTARDAFGNNASGAVQLTSGDGQVVSPATVQVSGGSATPSVILTRAGTTQLTATAGAAQAVSPSLTVNPAAMSGFTVGVPATATAGSPFGVTLQAHDRFGNVIVGYDGKATLYSSDGQAVTPNSILLAGGTGSGQVALNLAHKVTLTAIDAAGARGVSGPVAVSPATPIVTVFAPAVVTAGSAFGVTIKAVDIFGNGYSGPLTALTSSDGQAVKLSSPTVNLAGGVASVGVTLKTTDKLTLTAAAGGVTGDSGAITVLPAGIATFGVSAPATTTAGTSFDVNVTARDAFGNVTTTYNGGVYLLSSDGQAVTPGYALLTAGTGTASVQLTRAGSTTIKAALNGVVGVSGSLRVIPAAAASFTVSAPAKATAGTAFDLTITAKDAYGNVATGTSGTATLTSSDGQAVSPGTVDLSGGFVTVPVTVTTAHTLTLTAGAGAVKGTSGSIAVSPGAPAVVTVSAPATATAGVGFYVTLRATDAYGNAVTGLATLTAGDGQKVFYGSTVQVVNGTAETFIDLNTADTLTLTAGVGPVGGASGSLTVSPAAAVAFTVSTPASTTAGTPFDVTVTAHDAFGNRVTGFNGPVTLYSSDQQKVLVSGPLTLTGGVGTGRATLDIANAVVLTAVGGGVAGTGGLIRVGAAAPAVVKVFAPPVVHTGVFFGVTVTAKDQFGNAWSGPLTLTSSDGQQVTLNPSAVNLIDGAATFGVKLDTAGQVVLTAICDGTPGISSNISVLGA